MKISQLREMLTFAILNIKKNLPTKKQIKEEAKIVEEGLVKRETFKDKVLNKISVVLPYGRFIEKLYLAILLALFVVLLFEQGSVITEDKALILVVGTGGLFILRSLRKRIYFPKIYTILVSLFLVISAISTLFSVNIYNSLLALGYMFAAALLGILGYDIVFGKYSRRWIMNAFLIVFSGFLVYGIVKYGIDKTSLTYPLGFPAYMGAMIAFLLPFSLSSTLKTKGRKRILFASTNAILLLSAFLTFARPIWGIVILEVLVFIAINTLWGRKPLIKRRFYMPYLFIILAVVLAGFLLHFKTSGTIPFIDSSFADRNMPLSFHLDVLVQGWKSFLSSPFVGTGLNNFRLVSLYHEARAWQISYYMNNDILEMFVSTGILGGALFLSIFGYVFYEVFRKKNFLKVFKKQSPETSEISIGFIAVFILSLYYPLFHVPVILMVMFLFIGILLKTLTVDNVKRFYLGNLSIGLVNGFAVFFILMIGYFFFTNRQFMDIRNNLTQANATASQQAIQKLVQFNPINSSFSSLLGTIYLYEGSTDNAIKYTDLAMKYDKLSPYIVYTQAENYYYKGDAKKASSLINGLINTAPYADPRFYVLKIQIDQAKPDNKVLQSDLKQVVDHFPINADFYLYQPIFQSIGFNDTLAQVYLEYGVLTKDTKYQKDAQAISPSAFSVVGK